MTKIEQIGLAGEAAVAQSALLELLASTLDETLPIVQRADRADDTARIAALCARIASLGALAHQMGGWTVRAE